MKDFIQKYWINALGLGLLFTALLYFLKLAVASGWFPIELRLALSSLLGCSGLFFGFRLVNQQKPVTGQVLAGLGTAVLYATIGYISFSEEMLWSSSSLLIAMVGVSSVVSGLAVRQNQRILFALSILGGLITPFVIKASAQLDVALFIYVLILNLAAIYASISKGWKENMLIGFVLTIGLFSSYYFLFEPGSWQRPFTYCTIMFVVFMVGFVITPFRENKKYDGFELILGVFNGVNFILWSHWIFKEFSIPYVTPLLIVGVSFLTLSCLIYHRSEKRGMAAFGTYMAMALMSLGIAGNDLGRLYQQGGLNYVITAMVWLLLIASVLIIGKKIKDRQLVYGSMLGYLLLIVYWFGRAWEVDWLPVLGVEYIPFLNAGALVWLGLIILGFNYSIDVRNGDEQLLVWGGKGTASALLALVSHIQIGGLLTIQVMNLWEAYDMGWLNRDLSLSACWFLYALVLFLWNSRLPHALFRWLGGAVLIVSAAKVMLWDLAGESTTQKILFLLFLGGVTLIIGRIRAKKNLKAGIPEGEVAQIEQ
ncbi:MAG: DUF2339 domain-containing protein [Roseivirga sp.]|nr:DUF2339 domain-containing protein [Roseivirga sp.]